MPTRRKLGLSGLCLAAALLPCASGHAQERRDPAAAEELFRQGRAAVQQRDYLNACAKFRESNRLDPALGTLFNIADCEEKLGRYATSWTLFEEVAQRLTPDDDRRAIAVKRAQGLEARVPRLTVHLTPSSHADAFVQRDGVALGSASLDTALPVDPGEHVVVVEAPGTQPAQFRTSVGEGERAELVVSVGSVLAPGHGSGAPLNAGSSGSSRRAAVYVAGGIGAAGLVTGVVAGLLVLSHKSTVNDNCSGKLCNQAGVDAAHSGKTLGVVTTVGLVTGALGLGAATYLLLSAPAPTENARSGAYLVGIRATW
ncbi:MAG: hypothetical protein ABUL62_19525 [Myxococcales bacterium]